MISQYKTHKNLQEFEWEKEDFVLENDPHLSGFICEKHLYEVVGWIGSLSVKVKSAIVVR